MYIFLMTARTTVRLPEPLMRDLKRVAAETDRSMAAVIEDAVREHLARSRDVQDEPPVEILTFGRGGLLPGVDIDRTADLLDRMDEGQPIDKLR